MGHYRSEMGFEDEDERRRARKERDIRIAAERIQKDADERGMATVLAEIIIEAADRMIYIGDKYRR